MYTCGFLCLHLTMNSISQNRRQLFIFTWTFVGHSTRLPSFVIHAVDWHSQIANSDEVQKIQIQKMWTYKRCSGFSRLYTNLQNYKICRTFMRHIYIYFQEYSPRNSFSDLKQHYSAVLGLGALLSSPT